MLTNAPSHVGSNKPIVAAKEKTKDVVELNTYAKTRHHNDLYGRKDAYDIGIFFVYKNYVTNDPTS